MEQVIAVYDYQAQREDELSFLKGSVINVISKDGSEWWQGELNGQTGLLPFNYVKPLSEYTAAEQLSSQMSESRKNLFSQNHLCISKASQLLFREFHCFCYLFERTCLNIAN